MERFQMTRLEQERRRYLQSRSAHWDALVDRPLGPLSRHYRQRLADVYSHTACSGERILELGCGKGDLLARLAPKLGVGVDLSGRMIDEARARYPHFQFHCADAQDFDLGDAVFDVIILSDLLNDLWDVQATFIHILRYCHAGTRIVMNVQSHLWEYVRRIAEKRQWVTPNLPQNWLTPEDIGNLAMLSGYELVQRWQEVLCPADVPLLGTLLDRFLVKLPFFRFAALTNFYVIRPSGLSPKPCHFSVSVIVPARNEAGHIEEILSRIPQMGSKTEVIFVEGNSTDNTFETIQQALADWPTDKFRLIRQPGKGKGDAVRAGFEIATGDILMILDADMTVAPEELPRFYDVLVTDLGEFVNGVRLVYPMQDGAMRFFNLLGNKFFSWAFSWLLGQPIRDTLCGTKVLRAKDYRRIAANRHHFGDFDPFGDFDLLFGAARLQLKIMEIPIRYQTRQYGETNIRRWAHGWLLIKMVAFAASRLKFI